MATDMITRALLLSLGLAASARAGFPWEDMASDRLGLQYGFAFRGQDITAKDVPSHEVLHALDLGYAPIPYLGIEAGLGVDKLSVDRYNGIRFRGDYGLSPRLGLALISPPLFGMLRFAGGARVLYLNSEDERGYAYAGPVTSPFLSASLSPSGYFRAEAGARGHFIDGTMQAPGGSERSFANRETVRGFVSLTLRSPSESAFLTLDADISPAFDSDWSGGPRESSLGISFGTLLGGKAKSAEPKSAPPYFPAYPDLKERQNKMAEELE
jgi:hypothetical protein